ncbi:hypothetical protein GCM10023152_05860 [Agromyces bauzanensis]|uniref:Uncharacterized protein n=1 Tax=Agromyces bauzanensis TaxID=1308924 RepID=A0A917PBT1_9MICO|nr:hypothetical protein GCM10011372_04710 [Agromyces bauzanensis]
MSLDPAASRPGKAACETWIGSLEHGLRARPDPARPPLVLLSLSTTWFPPIRRTPAQGGQQSHRTGRHLPPRRRRRQRVRRRLGRRLRSTDAAATAADVLEQLAAHRRTAA